MTFTWCKVEPIQNSAVTFLTYSFSGSLDERFLNCLTANVLLSVLRRINLTEPPAPLPTNRPFKRLLGPFSHFIFINILPHLPYLPSKSRLNSLANEISLELFLREGSFSFFFDLSDLKNFFKS